MNCTNCGDPVDPRRVELGYDYCTRPECQERCSKPVRLAAVAVNKASDQYVKADEVAPASVARCGGASTPSRQTSSRDRVDRANLGPLAGGPPPRKGWSAPRPSWMRSCGGSTNSSVGPSSPRPRCVCGRTIGFGRSTPSYAERTSATGVSCARPSDAQALATGWEDARMRWANRFVEMCGCRYPLQQAGIGGLTTPDVAIAVADAGGLGMLSGAVGLDALEAQLGAVPSGAAVGVNFLVPFLDRPALDEACARTRFIEFFWGTPDAELVEVVHDHGARAAWQVGSTEEARAARDAGCDVVVAQGIEAGGHVRGTTALLPLLDEVQKVVDVPIIAAGGIGTGRAMAAALMAGAEAVRVGTRFVAALEADAHPVYVEALIRSHADDTIITTAYGDGWPDAPHRVLKSASGGGPRPRRRPELVPGLAHGSVGWSRRGAGLVRRAIGRCGDGTPTGGGDRRRARRGRRTTIVGAFRSSRRVTREGGVISP